MSTVRVHTYSSSVEVCAWEEFHGPQFPIRRNADRVMEVQLGEGISHVMEGTYPQVPPVPPGTPRYPPTMLFPTFVPFYGEHENRLHKFGFHRVRA